MREELIWEVERMLHERWQYHTLNRDFEAATAYKSACDILLAAVLNDEEILRQFDYYHDKVKELNKNA